MARSKNRSKTPRRVAFRNANQRLIGRVTLPALNLFEDRRLFHPEQDYRPALNLLGRQHRLVVPAAVKQPPLNRRSAALSAVRDSVPHRVSFEAPSSVLVCVRRQRRKEVLHALNKTGSGVSRRRPRRNWLSNVSC